MLKVKIKMNVLKMLKKNKVLLKDLFNGNNNNMEPIFSNKDFKNIFKNIKEELGRKVKINHKEIISDLNDTFLKDLLTKMLKIDPNQRINWNEYFQHDFF